MPTCLVSKSLTADADFAALDAAICINLGLPNEYGTTNFVGQRTAAGNPDLKFWEMPSGWPGNNAENFTAEQIFNGVDLSAFAQEELDPTWLPSMAVYT